LEVSGSSSAESYERVTAQGNGIVRAVTVRRGRGLAWSSGVEPFAEALSARECDFVGQEHEGCVRAEHQRVDLERELLWLDRIVELTAPLSHA
jgi:hypothetical protein